MASIVLTLAGRSLHSIGGGQSMTDQPFAYMARRSDRIIQLASESALVTAARVDESHRAVERSRDLLADTAPMVFGVDHYGRGYCEARR